MIIGPREIYDMLIRLDNTVSRLADQDEAQRAQVTDHETRIRLLERGRWPLPAASVLIALGALAVALVNVLNP